MSDETDHDTGDERRRFDDVASLFGNIVPPAGTPVRRGLLRALPQADLPDLPERGPPRLAPARKLPKLTEADLSPPAPPPLELPKATEPSPSAEPPGPKPDAPKTEAKPEVIVTAPQKLTPPQSARPAPKAPKADHRFKDAFTPRPNYRRHGNSRLWYWLFVIPFGAVVAIGVTMIDARKLRSFVDETLPTYLPGGLAQYVRKPAPARLPADATGSLPSAFGLPGTTPSGRAPGSTSPALPESSARPRSPSAEPPLPRPAPTANLPPAAPTPAEPPASPPPTEPPAAPAPMQPLAGPTPTDPPPEAPAQSAPPAAATAPPVTPAPPPVPVPGPSSSPAPSESPTTPSASEPVPAPSAPASETDTPSSAPNRPLAQAEPGPAQLIGAMRVAVYAGRNQAEAKGIAELLGDVALRTTFNPVRAPTILYFNAADREIAMSLAKTLPVGGGSWIVRQAGTRPPGTLQVWMP